MNKRNAYEPNPVKRPKTRAEYEAAAVALGRDYWEDTNVFGLPFADDIDADTLEPVSHDEADRRAILYFARQP